MKITKRKIDITTGLTAILTGISMMPYEIEKIGLPAGVKPWTALLGLIASGALVALRNQFPSHQQPPDSPASDS